MDSNSTFREAARLLVQEGMRPSKMDETHVFCATGQFLKDIGYVNPKLDLDTWYTGSIKNGFKEL